jgi:hypothetical protein
LGDRPRQHGRLKKARVQQRVMRFINHPDVSTGHGKHLPKLQGQGPEHLILQGDTTLLR